MIHRREPTALHFAMLFLLTLAACSPQSPATDTAVSDAAPAAAMTTPATDQPPRTVTAGVAPAAGPAEPTRFPASKYADLEIVTLLPQDAIPAIDDPVFLSAAEADAAYDPEELVIGVVFDGDARAYSVPFLSGHEIVNDTVGGRKIAITW